MCFFRYIIDAQWLTNTQRIAETKWVTDTQWVADSQWVAETQRVTSTQQFLQRQLWRRPGLHLNARTARAPSPVQACQGCQGELRHWLRPVQTDPPLRQHPLALALSIARARGQTRPDLTPFGAVCPKRHLRPMSTFQAFRAPQICPIFISFGSLLLFWLKKLVRRQASSTQIS